MANDYDRRDARQVSGAHKVHHFSFLFILLSKLSYRNSGKEHPSLPHYSYLMQWGNPSSTHGPLDFDMWRRVWSSSTLLSLDFNHRTRGNHPHFLQFQHQEEGVALLHLCSPWFQHQNEGKPHHPHFPWSQHHKGKPHHPCSSQFRHHKEGTVVPLLNIANWHLGIEWPWDSSAQIPYHLVIQFPHFIYSIQHRLDMLCHLSSYYKYWGEHALRYVSLWFTYHIYSYLFQYPSPLLSLNFNHRMRGSPSTLIPLTFNTTVRRAWPPFPLLPQFQLQDKEKPHHPDFDTMRTAPPILTPGQPIVL